MTRTALGAAAACVAAAALATPAQAGIITKSAVGCGTPELTKPFKPWLDYANYKLVDNGSFEDGTEGWTLTGGARVVNGNASQRVNDPKDSRSLLLPAGSTATTPPVCVGLDEPTMRYFARKNSGLLSIMTVSVQVQLELGGAWLTLPIGVDLGGSWHPSLPNLVLVNLLPLLPPDMTAVRFKFAPILGGAWQIDDVYVDPRARS
jgi:hypothetical protein